MFDKLYPDKCQAWIYHSRCLARYQCRKKVKVDVNGKKYCNDTGINIAKDSSGEWEVPCIHPKEPIKEEKDDIKNKSYNINYALSGRVGEPAKKIIKEEKDNQGFEIQEDGAITTGEPIKEEKDWEVELSGKLNKIWSELNKELIIFISKRLEKGREKYEKGFIDGSDSTGGQAIEIMAIRLKEARKEVIKEIEEELSFHLFPLQVKRSKEWMEGYRYCRDGDDQNVKDLIKKLKGKL